MAAIDPPLYTPLYGGVYNNTVNAYASQQYYSTGITVGSNTYPMTMTLPTLPKPKTDLEWLDEQVDELCAIGRAS